MDGARPSARIRVEMSSSGLDGSFLLAVPATPGYLVIEGPSDDYVLREISQRMLSEGLPGGRRVYSHGFIACDPRSGSKGLEINAVLRRGVTVQARTLAPDGQPTQDTRMFSRILLEPDPVPWRSWSFSYRFDPVRNGRFQVHGLDPDIAVPVYFLDPKRGSAPRPFFRASRRRAGQSPFGSNRAARPRLDWSTPPGSRSSDIVARA